MIIVLAKYYYGDQVKESDMGGECCTHGREEKPIPMVLLEDGRPGVDERMILKCILKIGCEGMDFIRLVRVTCRELGDELVGPIKCGTFLDYLKTWCFLMKRCAP
jgi:hypothetical protein